MNGGFCLSKGGDLMKELENNLILIEPGDDMPPGSLVLQVRPDGKIINRPTKFLPQDVTEPDGKPKTVWERRPVEDFL